jgi:two-component system response regulator LytT
MVPIKIGVVEDDKKTSERIVELLKGLNYIVPQVAINYDEALAMIENEMPDLLLLDINLPGIKDGIDIAQAVNLKYVIPFIFLTTNTDLLTIDRAKETSPAGYLIKPVNADDLYASIEIGVHKYRNQESPNTKKSNTIFIKDNQSYLKIKVNDILFLESNHVYVIVHTRTKKILVRSGLKEYYKQFDDSVFLRNHRSFIINKNHVESFDQNSVLIGGNTLPMGKQHYKAIKKQLYSFNDY